MPSTTMRDQKPGDPESKFSLRLTTQHGAKLRLLTPLWASGHNLTPTAPRKSASSTWAPRRSA